MKFLKYTLPLLLVSIVAISCNSSKAFYKKGQKLEEAGLTNEAANFYIDALKKKPTNDKAIIALKKTGQKILDQELAKFYQLYTERNAKDAVYAYLEAQDFKNKVQRVNVKLEQASYYDSYFKEVKEIYIKQVYSQAQQDLDNENFAGAELNLKEIQKLEPSYKDVEKLKRFAFVEPKYREALQLYDDKLYRKAYYLFDEIIKNGGEYKESKPLKDICQENAQFTIGILKFENKSRVGGIENSISGNIVKELMAANDPFLKIVDRTMTNQIISEQKLGMTGIIDEKTAAKAGEILGAKAILIGTVTNATKTEGNLVKRSKTGYLGKPITKKNPETGKTYRDMIYSKVYYYEYEQKNIVNCTFQYQLISAETGEILISDVVTKMLSDHINYATFNGETRYLYSGSWNSQTRSDKNDKIYNSYSVKKDLDQLLEAKQDIRTAEYLANEIYNQIAEDVSQKIRSYNPEL